MHVVLTEYYQELAKVAAALETVADDDLEDEDDQDDTGKASGMSEEDLKIFTKEVQVKETIPGTK